MVAVHLNFKTFSKYFQNELISLFFYFIYQLQMSHWGGSQVSLYTK